MSKIFFVFFAKSAKLQKNKRSPTDFSQWYLLELNQGHMDFQSIALPPELRYRCVLLFSVNAARGCSVKAGAKVQQKNEMTKFFCVFLLFCVIFVILEAILAQRIRMYIFF